MGGVACLDRLDLDALANSLSPVARLPQQVSDTFFERRKAVTDQAHLYVFQQLLAGQ